MSGEERKPSSGEPTWEELLASPHLTFSDLDLLPHLLAFGPPPSALPPRPWLYNASQPVTAPATLPEPSP